MKLNTYNYTKNGVTISIENRKQYWLLTAKKENGIIILHDDLTIHITLRSGKKVMETILSQY